MRINCPYCKGKARITHRKAVTAKMTEYYADCENPECAARLAFRLYHSHNIIPPLKEQSNSLHEQIANMDPDDRLDLFRQYAPALVQGKLF